MNGGKWNKIRPLNFFHGFKYQVLIFLIWEFRLAWLLRTFLLKKERVNSERRWWENHSTSPASMLCYIRATIGTPSPSVTVTKLRANSRTVAQRTLIIWAPSPRLCFRYSVVSNPYDQFNDRCLSLEIVLFLKMFIFHCYFLIAC